MYNFVKTSFALVSTRIEGRENPSRYLRFFFVFLYLCLVCVGEAQEESAKEETNSSGKIVNIPAKETREFNLETFEDLGYRMGEIFSIDLNITEEEFGAVSRGLSRTWAGAGPPEGFASKSRQSELAALMEAHRNRSESKLNDIRADLYQKNRKKGETFFAELDASGSAMKTENGLRYMIIQKGSGISPNPTNEVRFHLRGSRLNGETFINTYKDKQASVMHIQRLVPGLQEGLKLLSEGGKATFFVPSDLAYKDKGNGSIEPGETLTLEVELLEVISTAPAGPTNPASQKMRAQAEKVFDELRKKKAKDKKAQQ